LGGRHPAWNSARGTLRESYVQGCTAPKYKPLNKKRTHTQEHGHQSSESTHVSKRKRPKGTQQNFFACVALIHKAESEVYKTQAGYKADCRVSTHILM
jgi:hypothetical protein